MPNDITKLRRLMRNANKLRNEYPANGNLSYALSKAWKAEQFLEATANGLARFTYYKKDGTIRHAIGTRSPMLIPADKAPKTPVEEDAVKDLIAMPYYDLDANAWRSFNVLLYISLDQSWPFNEQNA